VRQAGYFLRSPHLVMNRAEWLRLTALS
jgi:hypothetical protein